MATNRNWEECATTKMVELVKCHEQKWLKPGVVPSVEVTSSFVPGKHHIKAAPLFELSAVSIHRETKGIVIEPEYQIYGQVKLTDNCGNHILLFNREPTDPEYVCLYGDYAFLPNSKINRPHLLSKFFILKLHLKDKVRGIDIINDELFLDFSGNTSKVNYDKGYSLTLKGRHKHISPIVSVRYTIFQCAVFASVEFTVLKNEERGSKSDTSDGLCDVDMSGIRSDNLCKVSVKGTIYALRRLRNEKHVSCLLFGKRFKDEKLIVNDPTKLSVVAVPAYSSLRIEADLNVDGEHIVSFPGLIFEPTNLSRKLYTKEIVGQKWRILVSVTWNHAFDFLAKDEYRKFVLEDDDEGSSGEESEEECFKRVERLVLRNAESSVQKGKTSQGRKGVVLRSVKKGPRLSQIKQERPQLRFYQPPLSDVSKHRILPKPSITDYVDELVEVFSISIHPYDNVGGALRLYGTILCYDTVGEVEIFNRDEKKPDMVYPNETIALAEPNRHYQGAFFCMLLDLKDAEGREISKGDLGGWNLQTAARWLSRRICSIVAGKDGFAAVHYTIFSCAMLVRPKVILWSDNCCQVHGRIRAWYSNHRYDTEYEKKYYRSMFFEKDESEFVELGGGGGEVPLSKSLVVVPRGASLVVEVDLCVRVAGEYVETMRGELTFEPQKPESQFEPQTVGPENRLSVSIEWI